MSSRFESDEPEFQIAEGAGLEYIPGAYDDEGRYWPSFSEISRGGWSPQDNQDVDVADSGFSASLDSELTARKHQAVQSRRLEEERLQRQQERAKADNSSIEAVFGSDAGFVEDFIDTMRERGMPGSDILYQDPGRKPLWLGKVLLGREGVPPSGAINGYLIGTKRVWLLKHTVHLTEDAEVYNYTVPSSARVYLCDDYRVYEGRRDWDTRRLVSHEMDTPGISVGVIKPTHIGGYGTNLKGHFAHHEVDTILYPFTIKDLLTKIAADALED